MDDVQTAIARIRAGERAPGDIEWLCAAIVAHDRLNGAIALERLLRLPSTYDRRRLAERDRWLCVAAAHINATSVRNGVAQLLEAWRVFVSRGAWRALRDDSEPPDDMSGLEAALYWATRHSRGQVLGERQLRAIVGNAFALRLPTEPPTIVELD